MKSSLSVFILSSMAVAGCPRIYVSCATSAGSQIRVFDLYNGQQEFTYADGWTPAGIVFSPSGHLYQWQQNGGPLWNIDKQTGARLDPLIAQNSGGSCQGRDVLFLPNETVLVSCGSSGVVRQYNANTGAYLGVFANCGICRGLALGPNGKVYSSGLDTVNVWNVGDGTLDRVLVSGGTGGLADAYDMVFDDEGFLLVSDLASGRILRFDPDSGEYLHDATEFPVPDARGMDVWQGDELFVSSWSGPLGDGVYRFDLQSGDFMQFYPAHAAMFVAITDCRTDFTCDGNLNFWDISQFLLLFQANAPWADLTGDGSFNFFDVSAFLAEYSAGCTE